MLLAPASNAVLERGTATRRESKRMSEQPSPSRLEAFSDGVIAVIITIMVLEFKVPAADGIAGLWTMAPTLGVYLLSFAFTAIYWVNHHHLVDRLKRVDASILYANLLFLCCLSLLPFFTGYLVQKRLSPFAAVVYCSSLLVAGLGFMLLSLAITGHLRRTGQEQSAAASAQMEAETRKTWLSMVLNVGAMLLAHWHPAAGLLVASLVVLTWIVPTFGLQHRIESRSGERAPQQTLGSLDKINQNR